MNFTKEELTEMESQLACPTGENGVQMAEMMNQSNLGMILKTIELLELKNSDTIIEIGPGNGFHLPKLLNQAENLIYLGLEISPTMLNEAKRINNQYIMNGKIDFSLYDGLQLPKERIFDKFFTVNTLYFWQDPLHFLNQIHEILKEGGLCAIAFAQKKFMKDLPFVHQKFTLYDSEDFSQLVQSSKFTTIDIKDFIEEVISKDQQKVQREYSVALLVR